jgi:DNA-binding NarL/FixJ family response regulator
MIRVTIVDDHQLFAEGLFSALDSLPDIELVAIYNDGATFLSDIPVLQTDVVLLDLEMPEATGLDVLSSAGRAIKAIVISMHSGADEQHRAKSLGASGFLSKSAPLSDVAAAVRAVDGGANLFEPATTLRDLLDEHREATLDPGAEALTQRERELLSLMAKGITATNELAESLFISHKTVKNHLASIYHKLAISDRAQAAVEAIRLGL